MQGDTVGEQHGGDAYISYAYDTWASYTHHGYTEFIELGFNQSVYIQSVEVGENCGSFSVTSVKAWDDTTGRWQTLYTGEADSESGKTYKQTNQYHKFTPMVCQTTFMSSVIRLELNTFSSVAWNEIDYVRLIGENIFLRPPASSFFFTSKKFLARRGGGGA